MKSYIVAALLLVCSTGLYSQEYKLPAGLTYEQPGNATEVTKTYKRKTDKQKSVIDESSDGIYYQIDDIMLKLYAVEGKMKENLLELYRSDFIAMYKQLGAKSSVVSEIKKAGSFRYFSIYQPPLDNSKTQMTSYIVDENRSILVTCMMVYPINERNKADIIFDKFLSRLRYKKGNSY